MSDKLETGKFSLTYRESDIHNPLLWERHFHAQFEMIGVLEGDIVIMLEGKKYRLQEKQTAIIAPLCYHTVTANVNSRYRRVTALFDGTAIPEALRGHFEGTGDIAIFTFSQTESLKNLCQKGDAYYAPLADALMTQCLYACAESGQADNSTETDVFLQRAIDYIDRHLYEKIQLRDLAKVTSRSESSLSHLFAKKMNISPKQYILQKKLALAHRLIREGMASTVVAAKLGYENYSNFYRLYLKQYGTAPTHHR